jgi:hypothetical protein
LPGENLDTVKKHLATLISRGDRNRIVAHGPEFPTQWWPGRVVDPRSKKPFTTAGAWDFIVMLLRQRGTVLKPKVLDKPAGTTAYVLLHHTTRGTIYIKVHFGGAHGELVVGRSFHYEGEE